MPPPRRGRGAAASGLGLRALPGGHGAHLRRDRRRPVRDLHGRRAQELAGEGDRLPALRDGLAPRRGSRAGDGNPGRGLCALPALASRAPGRLERISLRLAAAAAAAAATATGRRLRLVLLGRLLLRRRSDGPRLRPHADDLLLVAVARRPRLVVEHLAALVDDPLDYDGPGRLAVVHDQSLADEHARVRDALRPRTAGHLQRPLDALDAPLAASAEEPDEDAALVVRRLDDDPAASVVAKLQIDVRVVDGGVAPGRVAADVESVRRPLGDLDPGLPRRVEDRRRDLGDAAADAFLVLAVDDHGRRPEAALLGARPDVLVERPDGARGDARAVEELDAALEVRDPFGRARVQGRVPGELAAHAERARLPRRQRRPRLGD